MNTENRFIGWSRGEWACVIDTMLSRGIALPPATEDAAVEAQAWWYSNNLHDPSPNVIVTSDILGREVAPTGPRPEARRWAQRVMIDAMAKYDNASRCGFESTLRSMKGIL